jgi:hypothetical protein
MTPMTSGTTSPDPGENFTSFSTNMAQPQPVSKVLMVPNNKKTFERFFELKLQINNKKKELNEQKELENINNDQ